MVRIIPNIPKKYKGRFPEDFDNRIEHWGFFIREEIEQNKGNLLMMDIDFGRYCSLDCPECFRKSNVVDDIPEGDLSYDKLVDVIDEARDLGLKSVKICGAGEPTQNSKFLQFIEDMTKRDVGVAVFTKGQVLGSDEEAIKFNRNYGIDSAQELTDRLYQLKVSFMLGFQSFDTELQDRLVGNMRGHSKVRNRALENLVNSGFNNPNPTRLAICSNPITRANYDEVFDIYTFARERNIYPVTAVLMVSGKQINGDCLSQIDVSPKQKLELWEKIYSWNIERGVQTLEQIREEGISVLPGMHPCNQVACGLYLTAKGNVVGCPGYTEIEGNVRQESIKKIWEMSQNIRLRAGMFNCKCPPKDGITIPNELYDIVLQRLEHKYG